MIKISDELDSLPAVGEKVLAVGLLGDRDVMVEIVAHWKLHQYEKPKAVVRVIEEGLFDVEEGPYLNSLYYWSDFKPVIEPSDVELQIMNTLFPHVCGQYFKLTDEEKQIVVKVIGLIDSNRAQLS